MIESYRFNDIVNACRIDGGTYNRTGQMKQLLLPIAKTSSGHYISIDNADKGETYYCPGCHSPLIIKDGEIYRKHFSHPAVSNCAMKHGGESLYHKVAKDIICELGYIDYYTKEPKISIKNNGWSNIYLNEKKKRIVFKTIEQEKGISGFRGVADLAFTDHRGYSGYVEVVYGHAIKHRKSEYFLDNQITVIESVIPKGIDFTYEGLRDHIISGITNKLFSGDWSTIWAERYFSLFKEKVYDMHHELDPMDSQKMADAVNELNELEVKAYNLRGQISAMQQHLWRLLHNEYTHEDLYQSV